MPLILNHVQVPDGCDQPNELDRITIGQLKAVANGAGGGAGAAVNVDVTGLQLPAKYQVLVTTKADVTWFVPEANKTTAGFRVTLEPRLAANTIASGAIDILIIG